jgi:hypothetical protein
MTYAMGSAGDDEVGFDIGLSTSGDISNINNAFIEYRQGQYRRSINQQAFRVPRVIVGLLVRQG